MLPIAPLMIEHRLIERMIAIIESQLSTILDRGKVDPVFVDKIVDFIRTYADETHHGKEEDILFRELKNKYLSQKHQRTMNELIEEHKQAREATNEVLAAKTKLVEGDDSALAIILDKLSWIVEFYPKHIDKEDNHFFKELKSYFSKEELDAMLEEGQTYDRKMIHKKYKDIVWNLRDKTNADVEDLADNWLSFL